MTFWNLTTFATVLRLFAPTFPNFCLLDMKQQVSTSYESERLPDRPECHIAFSIRPFDPPSSPPPTSPLPPLPEIANYSHASSPSSISPIQPVFTMSRPIRPPRPRTSLPDLKPRTITSPEMSQQQRHSEIAVRARTSPTPTGRRQKILQAEGRSLKLSDHLGPNRSLTLTLESASRFSDEVLGALPKLFDKLSLSHSSPNAKMGCVEQTERIEPWRVYHGKAVTSPSKMLSLKKTTRSPVARTALFIPRTPAGKISPNVSVASLTKPWSPENRNSCYDIQSRKKMHDGCNAPQHVASSPMRQDHPARACHKRSQAVTSFSFDFGTSYTSGSSLASSDCGENLTSLPRIPSDPISYVGTTSGKNTKAGKVSSPGVPICRDTSEEAVTFAALPYAHTLHSAGPRPRTEKDIRVRFDDTDCDVEVGEEEVRQLTEEEIRSERRKRILWAIATITLVIISTSGILIGIIWKLRSLK